MPFDSTEFARVYSVPASTPRERLVLLIEELRKPNPDWDYRTSDKCAIGIAFRLFPDLGMPVGDVFMTTYLAQFFGVSESRLRELFTNPKTYGHRHFGKVTQEEVVLELEKLIYTADGDYA